jgi:uncharacterized RDD family membrane protein YckC
MDPRHELVPHRVSAVKHFAEGARRSGPSPVPSATYAHPLRRLAARVVDTLLTALVAWLLANWLGEAWELEPAVLLGIWLGVSWLYTAGELASPMQATLGQRLLGVYVIRADDAHEPVSFSQATLRWLAALLSLLCLGLGFAIALFDSRRRTFHDRVARTLVLNS